MCPCKLEFHRVASRILKSYLKLLSKSVEFAGGRATKRNDSRARCRRDLGAPRGPSAGTSGSVPALLYKEIAAKAPQAPPLSQSSQLTRPFCMRQHPVFSLSIKQLYISVNKYHAIN